MCYSFQSRGLPTSARARDRFGDKWFNFGVGLGPVRNPSADGELLYDFQFISSRRNIAGTGSASYAENILMAPIGVTYRRGLGDPEKSGAKPYVGASVGLLATYMESQIDDIKAGLRTGWHGSVYGGVTLSEKAYLEARYFATSKIRGIDLSGLSLSVGLRF